MILWLTEYLSDYISGFSVFKYLTLRVILAVITSLVISFLIGPFIIAKLKKHKGQAIRTDGPQSHLKKGGTPTMGGILILISVVFSTLLWGDLNNNYIWLLIFVTSGFGIVGWVDDYKKVVYQNSIGLTSRYKYLWQSIIGLIVALYLFYSSSSVEETTLYVPFFKNLFFNLGWLFIPFTYFVIVGTSNAVNLTDGLDGLAILPSVMVGGGLGFFAYLSGHVEFAQYLVIPQISGAGEVAIFCGAMIGAGLGFLWFNTYPAMIFMGDVGSLSLGAALGTIAVIVRQELVLFIMGGVFVIETLSVIVQVLSFKLTGKRVFRMAPIHHHFELKGWPEPRVIVRFWIISFVLVLIGLSTLKIR